MNQLKIAESKIEPTVTPLETQPAAPDTKSEYSVTREIMDYAAHLHFPEFLERYGKGLKQSKMEDNAIRRARFFHLIQMLQLTRGVPGYTAEAGVFRGLSSYLICHQLRRELPCFNGETHFMLDSFEGLSRPVSEDGEYPVKRHKEKAFTETSLDVATQTLSEFTGVNIHKGWIPEVFSKLPEQKYRFVHVDVDVYEPTLASFRYFYPRMSPGGILLCDDFGPWDDNNWPGCTIWPG